MKLYLDKIFFEKPILYRIRIIGILLVAAGIVFFYNPTILSMKIGITLVILGGFFLILLTDTKKHSRLSSAQMVLIMSSWTVLLFLITETASPEMFFLMMAIGITAIKELTNELITREFKKKLNFFVFLFFLIFIAIVSQKIISVFNI